MASTFEQYMAESGRQSELDALGRNPGALDAARNQYASGGGYGGATPASIPGAPAAGGDVWNTARSVVSGYTNPAISSLQGAIPEIQQKFSTQRQYLQGKEGDIKSRYQSLLDQISGQQSAETTRATRGTNAELARRGISNQSGLYDQEMNETLSPINRYYTGQIRDVGIQQEADLKDLAKMVADLTSGETSALREVQNTIAQTLMGGGSNMASLALSLLGNQTQQDQFNKQFALTEQMAPLQQQLMKAQIAQAQKNASASTGAIDYAGLWNEFTNSKTSAPSATTKTTSTASKATDPRAANRMATIAAGTPAVASNLSPSSNWLTNLASAVFRR